MLASSGSTRSQLAEIGSRREASFPVLDSSTPRLSKTSTRQLLGHRDAVITVGWSCDGRRLASGGGKLDKTLRIWTPERTEYKGSVELKGHTEQIMTVCWDPSHPDRLASTSYDKTTRLWDIRQGKSTATFTGPNGNMNMSWSPDGQRIAVGDRSDNVTLFDAAAATQIVSEKQACETNELAFTNNSKGLICSGSGSKGGQIRILNATDLTEVYSWIASTAGLLTLDVDPRGRYITAGGHDTLVSLWTLRDFACVRTLPQLDGPVRCLRFSHDGAFLATASEDNFINIYGVESGAIAHTIGLSQWGTSLAWNPVRHVLAYTLNEPPALRPPPDHGIRVFGV